MYFIVETKEQLQRLLVYESCYVQVVLQNDNYHPYLNKVCLVYLRNQYKGYILPIDHSETFSLDLEDIQAHLANYKTLYCPDLKLTTSFIKHQNIIDLNQVVLDQENKHIIFDYTPKVYQNFYTDHTYNTSINQIIPVTKHYERCENLYEHLKDYIGKETDHKFYQELTQQYLLIEQNGIGLDKNRFNRFYDPTWEPYSIKDNVIYTSYNLYNLTTRPTNAFNAINFLALNKEDGSRQSFIPKNDLFVEYDFEAYHLALIADLVGHTFDPSLSIHTQLGKIYFDKEELSEEEYQQAKSISFRQMYGSVQKEYKTIPFFQKIEAYIENLWNEYQENGKTILRTGRPLHLPKNSLNPQKVFNYVIQNAETHSNVEILKEINQVLQGKKSQVVLVVYDSFLVDYSLEDGKQVLTGIREIVNKRGLRIRGKVGKNYDSLQISSYL
jgi:hypothetical protein